jgi:hypothetical protein
MQRSVKDASGCKGVTDVTGYGLPPSLRISICWLQCGPWCEKCLETALIPSVPRGLRNTCMLMSRRFLSPALIPAWCPHSYIQPPIPAFWIGTTRVLCRKPNAGFSSDPVFPYLWFSVHSCTHLFIPASCCSCTPHIQTTENCVGPASSTAGIHFSSTPASPGWWLCTVLLQAPLTGVLFHPPLSTSCSPPRGKPGSL